MGSPHMTRLLCFLYLLNTNNTKNHSYGSIHTEGRPERRLRDLFFVKVHAVPVMGKGGHLTLPVLQKGDCPKGHEHTEEDCAWVVE